MKRICARCKKEFDERDLQESHDVPKYMGGTDSDGRHLLCKNCHAEYELEIVKLAFMNWIKSSPEDIKRICRNSAILVKSYFFNGGVK